MPASLTASEEFTLTVSGPSTGDPRTSAGVRGLVQPVLNRTLWNWRRMQDLLGSFCPVGASAPTAIQSIDTSTDRITLEGHGLTSNDPVRIVLPTGSTIPSGLSVIRLYYVRYVDADTIELSETSGPGAKVDITSGGVGNLYLAKIGNPLSHLFVQAAGGIGGKSLSSMLLSIAWRNVANTFTTANTFSNTSTFDKEAVFNDQVIVSPGASVRMSAPTAQTLTAPTMSVDMTTTFQHDFSGSPGAGVTVFLNSSTGTVPSAYEYKRIRYSMTGAYSLAFKSEGVAGAIVTFSAAGSHNGELWVWFDGTDWKGGHYSSSGTATPGASWF